MSEKPTGFQYSELYTQRGGATEDSIRLRKRLGFYLAHRPYNEREKVTACLREELGASAISSNLPMFFRDCALIDLLDSITIIYGELLISYSDHVSQGWLGFVARALEEENVAYRVDHEGGVHPAHDEEFTASRTATIALLDKPRYTAARKFFDEAVADLKQPHDTRDAIRKTFEAVENVAKLMVPSLSRLGATEVEKAIKPMATKSLTGVERDATNRMLASLAEWVNACHQYRHAPGSPEPDPPSLELALWMVSTGASHLRWLIAADQKLQPK
jgi:hypothetical protein